MPAARAIPVPRLLRLGLHLLVGALLAIAVLRALITEPAHAAWIVIAAAVVAAVYTAGPLIPIVRTSLGAAAIWLGILLVCWVGMLVLTPDAIWLAFAWYFLLIHLLRWRLGLILMAVTAVIAVAGFAWHQDHFVLAMAIGPLLGAGVVIATVWGFEQLYAESERRRALIKELQRTREELADSEREQGVLAERERLAREIHDTLTQGFSSVNLLLTAAEHALPDPGDAGESGRARNYVHQARTVAAENLAESRRLVSALAPKDLASSSLLAALGRLAASTPQTGEKITFRREGEPYALPTALEVALLRIGQAAVANSLQHAGADRIAITLTFLHDQVLLDIVDDGAGFDPSSARPAPGPEGGFGLTSMRSRASELGGTFTVESAPGGGCAVGVRFPIGGASQSRADTLMGHESGGSEGEMVDD